MMKRWLATLLLTPTSPITIASPSFRTYQAIKQDNVHFSNVPCINYARYQALKNTPDNCPTDCFTNAINRNI
jgi:hypothetical protein